MQTIYRHTFNETGSQKHTGTQTDLVKDVEHALDEHGVRFEPHRLSELSRRHVDAENLLGVLRVQSVILCALILERLWTSAARSHSFVNLQQRARRNLRDVRFLVFVRREASSNTYVSKCNANKFLEQFGSVSLGKRLRFDAPFV